MLLEIEDRKMNVVQAQKNNFVIQDKVKKIEIGARVKILL